MISLVLKVVMFLSALLLFILQPLYAKHLLPFFGGAAAVWTVTMFFFTCVLCVGYLYAAWLMKDTARARLLLHGTVAVLALVLVFYSWWQTGAPLLTSGVATSFPGVGVFLTLLSSVLLPVLLLATTAVVVQKLYSWHTGENPYPLYALSNAGSLLGLLLYPFILELWIDSHSAMKWWGVGFAAYVLLLFSAFVAVRAKLPKGARVVSTPAVVVNKAPWSSRARWVVFLLSAVPAFILVAATEHVNQAVAGLPLLWVAPLALYLVSFMLAYREGARLLSPISAAVVGGVTIITFSALLTPLTISGGILIKGIVCASGFLLLCWWFHRQLYERRPETEHLGLYYTLVTVGGVAGSVVVTFLLPLVLNSRPELFVSLVGVALYGLWTGREVLQAYLGKRVAVGVVLAATLILVAQSSVALGPGEVARERNFYGVLRVSDTATEIGGERVAMRMLVSGTTVHGVEAHDAQWRGRLLSYYSTGSGVGLLLQRFASNGERPRVAAVGLGVGVLNYYCDELARLDYIEINPAVYELAQDHFSFLKECPEQSGVTIGDGRTVLEEWSKSRQKYDVVVIDAFTDDAIPLHLLTTQAFERAYLPLLTENGVLAFHVTNRHLALTPVVVGAAKEFGLSAVEVRSDDTSEGERAYRTIWVLVGKEEVLAPFVEQGYPLYEGETITWSDTRSSVLEVLEF